LEEKWVVVVVNIEVDSCVAVERVDWVEENDILVVPWGLHPHRFQNFGMEEG
jgi:hypothetical protein